MDYLFRCIISEGMLGLSIKNCLKQNEQLEDLLRMDDEEFYENFTLDRNLHQAFRDGRDAASMKFIFPDIRLHPWECANDTGVWFVDRHTRFPLRDPLRDQRYIPHPTYNWWLWIGVPLMNMGAIRDYRDDRNSRGDLPFWTQTPIRWEHINEEGA